MKSDQKIFKNPRQLSPSHSDPLYCGVTLKYLPFEAASERLTAQIIDAVEETAEAKDSEVLLILHFFSFVLSAESAPSPAALHHLINNWTL